SKSTITSNTATGNGGGVQVDTSSNGNNFSIIYSRIAGNSATAGKGLNNVSGSVTATDNWWGCNLGPRSAPCDLINGTVSLKNTLNQDAWITFSNSFSKNQIQVGSTATLTASFLKDNNGNSIPATNLSVLVGLPVTGSIFGTPVNGTLSNVQNQIQ